MKKISYDKIINKYLNLIEQQGNKKIFSINDARKIGDELGIDWNKHSIENFKIGINIELEHGTKNPKTNITNDDPIMTGKIALVHMEEIPGTGKGDDYYSLLKKYIEKEN